MRVTRTAKTAMSAPATAAVRIQLPSTALPILVGPPLSLTFPGSIADGLPESGVVIIGRALRFSNSQLRNEAPSDRPPTALRAPSQHRRGLDRMAELSWRS